MLTFDELRYPLKGSAPFPEAVTAVTGEFTEGTIWLSAVSRTEFRFVTQGRTGRTKRWTLNSDLDSLIEGEVDSVA